ncbi:MAG: lipid-A-disaccharide synthase [Candidatus Binatia bacterium]|nr:lipid-A-disaccharide synthase [Candidatus Binatia bacterium]MDG2011483.1 lipid-A-disaccharide synthase [Candidatus Binatia bacterium]
MSGSPHVLLVAGESSGDLRGAELVRALRDKVPGITFSGVGGDRLRAEGMEILVAAEELSIMGLTEVVGQAGTILSSYRKIRRAILGKDGARPDLVILIDFPDFNLRLAGVAKRNGIPVFYYVGPQVWAWRRYRIGTLARRVDRLAVVFPFEADLYKGLTRVDFVGHPALETVRADSTRSFVRAELGLSEEQRLVAVLPGSRRAEINSLLPIFQGALARQRDVRGVIALAGEELRPTAESLADPDLPILTGRTWDLVAAADLVLLSSGTATLETALLGTPMVVAYQLSPLSFAIAKRLVQVDHIAMPNLILERRAVPELVQDEVTVDRVAAAASEILEDPELSARMRRDLALVRERLGTPGAADRAADIAIEMLRPANV